MTTTPIGIIPKKLNTRTLTFLHPTCINCNQNSFLAIIGLLFYQLRKRANITRSEHCFQTDGLEGAYRKSNPWCITKLYAVKEDGEWRLKNALPVITEKWDKKAIGKITFIYPQQHQFNDELATKANQFCHELTKEFKFLEWRPFEFTSRKVEMRWAGF